MPFANDLLQAVRDKQSRVCVGIDPMPDRFPEAVRPRTDDPRAVVDAFYEFVTGVLDAVADVAACVKFQSAYFERFHTDGVNAYFELVAEAKGKGLLVIGDAKRGDIGATSTAYAAGHLAPHPADDAATPDALTVNPMLGLDTVEPFASAAKEFGKGLFVLVRTSNPGSAALQDVELADGRTWSEALGRWLASVVQRARDERRQLDRCGGRRDAAARHGLAAKAAADVHLPAAGLRHARRHRGDGASRLRRRNGRGGGQCESKRVVPGPAGWRLEAEHRRGSGSDAARSE